ncbi:MAG: hypothetical protein ACTSRW_09685 [Candidatus Helarchaeota archaeon]
MVIQLREYTETARVLSPYKDFKEEEQVIHYREHPLTGEFSILPESLTTKRDLLYRKPNEAFLDEMIEKTSHSCFFCSDNLESSASKFPNSIFPEGRMKKGKSVQFPNLFSFTCYSSVIVFDPGTHFTKIGEFTPELIADALLNGIDYIKIVKNIDNTVNHACIGVNYLGTAGSSIFHPHAQVILSTLSFPYLEIISSKSKEFYEKHELNFWDELIKLEAKSERYIEQQGSFHWMVPYAPRGNYEIQGICEKKNLDSLNENDITALASEIVKILKLYAKMKRNAFNFILFFGPLAENQKYFNINFSILTRPNYNPGPTVNDTWFLPKFCYSYLIFHDPEKFARKIKKVFGIK